MTYLCVDKDRTERIIETWRFAASLQETKEKRPDLYAKYVDKK